MATKMSIVNVIKRDKSKEKFDINKIIKAVKSAYESEGLEITEPIIEELKYVFSNDYFSQDVSVEEIQDEVEKILFDMAAYKVAKAYVLYRERHKQARFIRERLDYMTSYSQSSDNAATSSETDANSNVNMKNVANLEGEVYKTTNRIIQRQRMKDKLEELFPDIAKQYEKDLENHIIYTHDEATTPVLKYYCCAVTLYPLMLEGSGNMDKITPSAPNDIQSFSGQVTNLAFLLSSQCKGAVAFGDYFIALNYYVIKEFGDKWYEKLDAIVTTDYCLTKRTILDSIRKGMKQFIYGVNQPAGNRGYNSPFTNCSFYDKYYFESLFGEFYYPDGTRPEWKAIDTLQRIFMKLHRDLRLIKPLTFPVTTMALVYNEDDFLDKDYKELCAEEWAKGGSFFCYNNNNPASLASCCFSGDTKVLWKSSTKGVQLTTLKELHELPWEDAKKNLRIFHNGSWISGRSIVLPGRQMYKVVTENGKQYVMTDNHINLTLRGEKPTECLTSDDYLMFNTLPLNAIPEKDEHLTYSQGFIIGAFLGDGSFGSEVNGVVYQTIISQNEQKVEKCKKEFEIALEQLGIDSHINVRVEGKKHSIEISSKDLVQFIIKWTNWYRGTYSNNKRLNLDCLLQSKSFRKGILDGWYNTDGGNSNRCYTTSQELAEGMEALITSLGMQSIIDISDRTDEPIIIRGEHYSRNFPLYCVRWYSEGNHRTNKDEVKSWIKKNNSIYFKIKSIEKLPTTEEFVYCIECNNREEPYFTLPSGLITHNCRVLNELSDNTFSSTTGMSGVMTGSVNVITLNINRIIQNYFGPYKHDEVVSKELWKDSVTREQFVVFLISILDRVYKYHIAYKTMLYDLEDKGMFAASNAGYIYMRKLYSTIGLIGYSEAAQFLGLKVGNNEQYIEFLQLILGTIKEQNKLHSINDKKRPFLFNEECIPGEGLGIKFFEADKKDDYWIPNNQNLYNCYFFNPWDNTSVLDKIKLHGGKVCSYCDGGQACHINLDSHLSKEQYLKILDIARTEGCNYFTFNIPMSECKDCNHTVNAPIEVCPKCGSTNIRYWTRIIGYLTAVDNWSYARQIEQKNRTYSDGKNEIKVC